MIKKLFNIGVQSYNVHHLSPVNSFCHQCPCFPPSHPPPADSMGRDLIQGNKNYYFYLVHEMSKTLT